MAPIKVPIKDRHVFVTGGSSGIGLALARQATFDGARVSILARNPNKLEEARASIRQSTGADVAVFSADVRDADALQQAIEKAGPIDVLICNHGVFAAQELELQDLEAVKFMIDVNLTGTINLIKAALPGMKNRGDRGPASIAMVSSQAGQVGIYGYAAYSAKTDTPGQSQDLKTRPELCNIIVASSSPMKPDEVAAVTLNGIKSGTFSVACNFDGVMLSVATAGFSPQRSYLVAFLEGNEGHLGVLNILFFLESQLKCQGRLSDCPEVKVIIVAGSLLVVGATVSIKTSSILKGWGK
ncbi:hypothetical protein AAC387_Pa09g1565 [Persea americana]